MGVKVSYFSAIRIPKKTVKPEICIRGQYLMLSLKTPENDVYDLRHVTASFLDISICKKKL